MIKGFCTKRPVKNYEDVSFMDKIDELDFRK